MKLRIGFLILFQFIVLATFAEDKPSWLTDFKHEDSDYKYYLGRSSEVAGESNAISEAVKNAYEQAHRENFGSVVKIDSSTYQSNTEIASVARTTEKSKSARFEDFEQVKFYLEKTSSGRFNSWVLYKFLKQSIIKEKVRLKNLPEAEEEEVAFSIQGNQTSKGVLQVSSTPQSASIYIDGERYGKTPLQLNGQLDEGRHKIRIEHPSFESVEEDFIIGRNQKIRIDKVLVKATGQLSILTNIPNASISINGKFVGLSPIEDLKLEAGVKHKIEITHAETEKFSQEVEVGKNDEQKLELTLPLKPAYLTVNVLPAGATIFIAQKKYTSSAVKVLVSPGSGEVRFEKELFEPKTISYDIKGGENLVLSTVNLISKSEYQQRVDLAPYILRFGLGAMTSPHSAQTRGYFKFNASFEKQFNSWFGTGLTTTSARFNNKKAYEDTGTPNTKEFYYSEGQISQLELFLSVYLSDNLSVSPLYGVSLAKLTTTERRYTTLGFGNDYGSTEAESSTPFYGLNVTYTLGLRKSSWGWYIGSSYKVYKQTNEIDRSTIGADTGLFFKF